MAEIVRLIFQGWGLMQGKAEEIDPARATSAETVPGAPESPPVQESPAAGAAREAHTALRARNLPAARTLAQSALDVYGPAAALFAVLGQAHTAENEDDHDDRADEVFRRGLALFPDDLDLLAAHAELCLNSDPFDRPARHRRGPELTARLRELAPYSPQTTRAEHAAANRGRTVVGGGTRPPSPVRVQSHDARAALTAVPDRAEAARLAREKAQRFPHDVRLAILAETLTALAAPGRGLFTAMVRAPLAGLSALSVGVSALVLAPPAFHLPWWTGFLGLVLWLPFRLLRLVLHAARLRAETATPPDPIAAGQAATPPLPPVPAPSRRETTVSLAAIVLVVGAVVGSAGWSYVQYRAYPRYTISAPTTFRDTHLLSDSQVAADISTLVETENADGAIEPFTYLYGSAEEAGAVLVIGATGDFHDVSSDSVRFFEEGLRSMGLRPGTDAWDADPGRLGGWLRCVPYEEGWGTGGSRVACSWADKGSTGTVTFNGTGLDHQYAPALTRALREAILHP
ncbi:hypothetical protein [Streptomyces sp. NPDC048560]|uniref:hypothetical protein n=1 Tax=Streptomyces sp. NPDC048560 TaxID=3155488 RepID=UPI003443791F